MKLRTGIVFFILLAAALASMGTNVPALVNSGPQASTSISFTVTTTTNYQVTTGGALQVMFDSIQVTAPPPQAYSFGVRARTFPGLWITRLVWQFGDGAVLDVPYCCQSEISEVQYHAYSSPDNYTVNVVAFDNAGNFGNAVVTVHWTMPVPEYPVYSVLLVVSLMVALFGVASIRKKFNG